MEHIRNVLIVICLQKNLTFNRNISKKGQTTHNACDFCSIFDDNSMF